jgi:PAS domain S-box-containing protein
LADRLVRSGLGLTPEATVATKPERKRHPLGFKVYVAFLSLALIASLADSFAHREATPRTILLLVVFGGLLAVAEHMSLSFHDSAVKWGLSAAEAVMLPMLVILPFGYVRVGAAAGMLIARARDWPKDPVKETFNVAQYGCSAWAAAAFWNLAGGDPGQFGLRQGGVAVVAVVLFVLLTHLFVGIGIQLAGLGRARDMLSDIASPALINLAANIVLGLFVTAAYVAAEWTLFLFPVALAGLYFGYRAVVRQSAERSRMQQLHEASRSLAVAVDLEEALRGFLPAVADAVSALGARAIVRTTEGLRSTTVYAGEVTENLQPAENTPIDAVLDFVNETRRPLIYGGDRDPVPPALRVGNSGRGVICVPVYEDERVSGLLVVADRVGADEFGHQVLHMLEALSNELALRLQSYRLFEEVSEEKERFHLLVDAVNDYAIYMMDPEGRVVSWNGGAERILGYGADEIEGQHHSVFYPGISARERSAKLTEAASIGRLESQGDRARKDGSTFLANEVITPVRDPAGDLRGFAVITRDVTERVRSHEEREHLQAQLHQAQKLETVGQLAGGIAHDFNNLLSVVSSSAQYLVEGLPEDDPMRQELLEIKAAAKRGSSLTRQLLIFSRRDRIDRQVLSVNDVVRDTFALLTRALGEHIAVEHRLDETIPLVMADAGQLEQVILNLSINARDAMATGGTLTIATSTIALGQQDAHRYLSLSPGDYVRLVVSDTGTGMSPEIAEKAFDPFFTTKPKGVGTGLGLATVYGIVTGSGGDINVTSREGWGTQFEILLPVAPHDEPAQLRDVPAPADSGRGETILLVEDDDSVRAITKKILEARNYVVLEASGGKDALVRFAHPETSIDLLLSDIVMPDMSGVELADRLRRQRPSLKVAFMSGYSADVFSAGDEPFADELIQKPFEKDDLLGLVRRLLDLDSSEPELRP